MAQTDAVKQAFKDAWKSSDRSARLTDKGRTGGSTLMPGLWLSDPEFERSREDIRLIKGYEPEYVPMDYSQVIQGTSPDERVTEPGPQGLDDAKVRYLMGRASTILEKAKTFKEHYPDGDVVAKRFGDDDDYSLAFRYNRDGEWRKVDADLGKENIFYDIVDLAGEDFEAIAAEIWGASKAIAKGVPINLLKLAGYSGITAGGGELIKEAGELATGRQQETLGEIGKRAAFKGGLAGTFAPVGEVVVRKTIDVVRGGGLGTLRKGARETLEASKRLGVKAIPAHMGLAAPWLKKMGLQSQALFSRVNTYVDNILEGTKDVLTTLAKAKGRTTVTQDLNRLEKVARGRLIQAAGKRLGGYPRTNIREVSKQLAKFVREFDAVAVTNINNLYRVAREVEPPAFNLAPLQQVARNILNRGDMARRFRQTTDEEGKLVEESVVGTAVSQLDNDVVKILQEIAETTRMEPRMVDGVRITPTDQLNYWAEILSDAAIPALGEPARRANKLAAEGVGAIRRVMDQPSNTSPEFRKAWAAARKAAHSRFNVLEGQIVKEALTTESPAMLIRRILSSEKGGNPDVILQLQKALDPPRFEKLKTAFRNNLMGDPDTLTKRLADFSPEFRRVLMSDSEYKSLLALGQGIDKLNQVGIREALAKQATFARVIDKLARNKDTLAFDTLSKMIAKQGGKNSPMGRNIRASIIDHIYRRSTKPSEAGKALDGEVVPTKISAESLGNVLNEYKDSGLLKLLDPEEVRALADVHRVNAFLADASDPGTSLMGAQTASGLRSMTRSAFVTMAEAFGVGRFLISPLGRRVLLGIGKKKMNPSRAVAAFAGSLGVMVQDAESVGTQLDNLIEAYE